AFPLTVSETGRLTARVTPSGNSTLVPRLTLLGPNGQVLIQSNDGTIVQHLQAGTYTLTVSAGAGAGNYRLSTDFSAGSSPLAPLTVGAPPKALLMADLNGDGWLDLITANSTDKPVSVLLGNGDGTFQPQKTYTVGDVEPGVPGDVSHDMSVAVADVNQDGKHDIIVANGRTDTVTVLLGYGDGTFQDSPGYLAQHTFAALGPFSPGSVAPRNTPIAVAVADVNGDGPPEVLTANYSAN